MAQERKRSNKGKILAVSIKSIPNILINHKPIIFTSCWNNITYTNKVAWLDINNS